MVGLAEKSPKRFSILERSASEKGTCTLTTPSAPATSHKGANTVGGCGAGVGASAGHVEQVWAEIGDSRQPVGGPEGGMGPSGLLVDKEEEGGVWMGGGGGVWAGREGLERAGREGGV